MSGLRDMQQCVYRAIAHGRNEQLEGLLVDGGIPAASRIRVYVNNLRETARKTLALGFPVVDRLVGALCFRNLARVYVSRYPSRSGNLARFGASFPQFLAEFYHDTPFGYLEHVANIEWACVECELAPNGPAAGTWLAPEATDVDPAELQLVLHPQIRLLHVRDGAFTIWKAHQSEEDRAIDLVTDEERVLVYRDHSLERVIVRSIDRAGFRFIDRVLAGDSLLSAQVHAADAQSAFEPSALLRELYEAGLCIGFAARTQGFSHRGESDVNYEAH